MSASRKVCSFAHKHATKPSGGFRRQWRPLRYFVMTAKFMKALSLWYSVRILWELGTFATTKSIITELLTENRLYPVYAKFWAFVWLFRAGYNQKWRVFNSPLCPLQPQMSAFLCEEWNLTSSSFTIVSVYVKLVCIGHSQILFAPHTVVVDIRLTLAFLTALINRTFPCTKLPLGAWLLFFMSLWLNSKENCTEHIRFQWAKNNSC